MILRGLAGSFLARTLAGQVRGGRRRRGTALSWARWERWVGEPRSAVLLILFSVLVLGGGRKLLQARRARNAIGRLDDPGVSPEVVAASAEHGRAVMMDLFRLLGGAEGGPVRDAAGHALSVLWARDDLIAEEEKALVRRGFRVDWKARRKFPRGLQAPIPVEVRFGVPFLREPDEGGVGPENLLWSYRVSGSRRARLEIDSPWVAGPGVAGFEIVPSDFETDGPHRLVFQARVKTVGLTGSWELELPHVPFTFEFDPRLAVDALFALPDAARASAFAEAVRLAPVGPGSEGGDAPPRFLPLNEGLAIREAPGLLVNLPLPCDLAHAVELEFGGLPGRFSAGALTLSGQGGGGAFAQGGSVSVPIGPVEPIGPEAIERPGKRPMRVRLLPDPDRGWADPEVRSIWPEAIETGWVDVEIVRR